MARKSRKNIAVQDTPKRPSMKVWQTAFYIRLSVEFNGKRGDSLETQRQIMEAYIALCPDIEIAEDELKIDTYRASGAGGQHVNKTSSAIRITHLPTGIVVQCQNERSQHHNRDKAMQMLKAKLTLLKEQEQAEKVSDIRGEIKEIGFGNQIRSYVMHPYTMVKDHRTGAESSNVNAVMDGALESFINAYLCQGKLPTA